MKCVAGCARPLWLGEPTSSVIDPADSKREDGTSDSAIGSPPPTAVDLPPSTDQRPPTLRAVFGTFLRTGATTFGGMWAAAGKLERDLVDRAGWISRDDLRASFVLATLIPAPRFLGLAALVGYRIRGWRGATVGALGLIAPASLLVLGGAMLISPELLAGALAPLTRTISVAVVAVLFASAVGQLRTEHRTGRASPLGIALCMAILAAVVLGVPIVVAAIVGFALGALLLRPESASKGP